jgi:hypothetical protein
MSRGESELIYYQVLTQWLSGRHLDENFLFRNSQSSSLGSIPGSATSYLSPILAIFSPTSALIFGDVALYRSRERESIACC